MALIVRGEVLRLKEQEYVMAAINLGASPMWIILKHLIPNSMGQIIVRLTMDIPSAIFTEAFLSFIGIGVPAPLASWGSLANDGYKLLSRGAHLFIIPSVFISLTTLSFNMVGDGLRDALDPRLRK
jgi:oligopeptide transport system permease protein